jgi:uncharacterized iron-regulated membrane protein
MKRLRLGLGLAVAIVFLFGCVSPGAWSSYNLANTQFTETAQQYELYYQAQDETTQAEWKVKFDPIFLKGDIALTAWRDVLNAGDDPYEQQQAVMRIKQEIILMLIEVNK